MNIRWEREDQIMIMIKKMRKGGCTSKFVATTQHSTKSNGNAQQSCVYL